MMEGSIDNPSDSGFRGPEASDRYFFRDARAVEIETRLLIATEVRPEGVARAARLMEEAFRGQRERRRPLLVRRRDDGHFDVLDGNSTLAVARVWNWNRLPVVVEGD
jgi:hypothetical protein